jgi:hypothetical protein
MNFLDAQLCTTIWNAWNKKHEKTVTFQLNPALRLLRKMESGRIHGDGGRGNLEGYMRTGEEGSDLAAGLSSG